MTPRQPRSLTGPELWRIVAELHKKKCDPHTARTLVILEWLHKGDPGPLIAAIDAGEAIDRDVLRLLADLLKGDPSLPCRLEVKRPPGAPLNADANWRDAVIGLAFTEMRQSGISYDEAIQLLADNCSVSTSTVAAAVTRYQRLSGSSANNNK